MHMSSLQFKIDQLRKDKMIYILETLSVFVLALFVTAFLPQLIFQYVYANAQLTAEPAVFQYITPAAFGVAVLFFLYAMITNIGRARKIRSLEKELELMEMNDDCCGGNCGCGGHGNSGWSFENDLLNDDMEDMEVEVIDFSEEKAAKPAKKTTKKSKTTKK